MLLYATLGSNDLTRSASFYDAVLAPLGATRTQTFAKAVAWSVGAGPGLMLTAPFDGQPASKGNGQMIALAAAEPHVVDEVHQAAMASGGACEGRPGERAPGFYAAYFRDPDGNKLAAVCIGVT